MSGLADPEPSSPLCFRSDKALIPDGKGFVSTVADAAGCTSLPAGADSCFTGGGALLASGAGVFGDGFGIVPVVVGFVSVFFLID